MKKLVCFIIIGLILGSMAAFADDAKVMPARVGRVYVAPLYAFSNGTYDSEWKYEKNKDNAGDLKLFNLGFAVEYGVIDWITAAVQWAPGWTIWSDIDQGASDAEVNINGVYDLFVGAKIQLVGEKAPVKTSMFRVAFAPGVKIPLPGHDFEEEFDNMNSGDPFSGKNADKHVFGFGARGYFDYIINDNFYVNLYGEFIYYPIKADLEDTGVEGYGRSLVLKAMGLPDVEVDYGYDLTLEVEPHFDMPITEGLNFSAGLPIKFVMSPGVKYSKEYPALMSLSGPVPIVDQGFTFAMHLVPNVSFFFTRTLLPLEFKLSYNFPVLGQNTNAVHNVNLQMKVYFAFPSKSK